MLVDQHAAHEHVRLESLAAQVGHIQLLGVPCIGLMLRRNWSALNGRH